MSPEKVPNGETDEKNVAKLTLLAAHLTVEAPKASEAVQFYKDAFGAVEIRRTSKAKRKANEDAPHVTSAHLQIGSSSFVVSESESKIAFGGGGMALMVETRDVKGVIKQVEAMGGELEGQIEEDEGGMVGKVKDPYGFLWIVVEAQNAA